MAVAPVLVVLFPALAEALNLPIHNMPLLLTMWVAYMVVYVSVLRVLSRFYFPKFPDFFAMPGPITFVRLVGGNVILILQSFVTVLKSGKCVVWFFMAYLWTLWRLAHLNVV